MRAVEIQQVLLVAVCALGAGLSQAQGSGIQASMLTEGILPVVMAEVMAADQDAVALRVALEGKEARPFVLKIKGKLGLVMTGKGELAGAKFTLDVNVACEGHLRFLSGRADDEIIHTSWRFVDNKITLTGNVRISLPQAGMSESADVTSEIILSEGASSGWVEATGEGRSEMSEQDMRDAVGVWGIGTDLLIDMTPNGRIVAWEAADDLDGAFTEQNQANLVALISGFMAPTFPEDQVAPKDGWRVTPGSKNEAVLASDLTVAPEDLAGRFSALQRIVQNQLARENVAGSSLSQEGGMVNPFSWGVDLDYVYQGRADVPNGPTATRQVTFQTKLTDQEIQVDEVGPVAVDLVEVDGTLYLHPTLGWPLRASAKTGAELQFEDATNDFTIEMKMSSDTTLEPEPGSGLL